MDARRGLKVLVASLLAVGLNIGWMSSASMAQPPPKGAPSIAADAYTKMHCRFGELESGSSGYGGEPYRVLLTCNTHRYGDFWIEVFQNGRLGRALWLEDNLDEDSYIAVKGNMVITAMGDDAYGEKATAWAARNSVAA